MGVPTGAVCAARSGGHGATSVPWPPLVPDALRRNATRRVPREATRGRAGGLVVISFPYFPVRLPAWYVRPRGGANRSRRSTTRATCSWNIVRTRANPVHARYTGTIHPDITRQYVAQLTSQWIAHQHRDTSTAIVGNSALVSYLAIADGSTKARTRYMQCEVRPFTHLAHAPTVWPATAAE